LGLTIIGSIPILYWLCKAGDPQENKYGKDPKAGNATKTSEKVLAIALITFPIVIVVAGIVAAIVIGHLFVDAETYSDKCLEYLNKDDYDSAIAACDEAIKLDPNLVAAYINRGATYDSKGDYDRAISDYTEAIRLDPNLAVVYNNRGAAYVSKGDYDRAISNYNEAIRLNPNYAVAYKNRGDVYIGRGDYDKAIADFEAALRIDPNDDDARWVLEEILERFGSV